jgi:Aldo/keto reductase family
MPGASVRRKSRPSSIARSKPASNFFDTANRYSLGNSEEILGRAIRDFAWRDEVVNATKVYGRMRPAHCRLLCRTLAVPSMEARSQFA